jgi:hypothetical protein
MTLINWQDVLQVYMRHVYDGDHIIADPDYGMVTLSGATNAPLDIPTEALEWMRKFYREMLKEDGMTIP